MSRSARSLLAMLVATLAFTLTSCGGSETQTTDIAAPDDVAAQIADGAVVIDVRTPEEFNTGHLAEAINIDLSSDDFESRIGELDKGAAYVVYCQSGNRSTQAVQKMLDMGFEDVVNGGGIGDLVSAGIETQ